MPSGVGSGHEVVFLPFIIFVEQFVDGAGEDGEFFLGELFDDFDGFIGLLFCEPDGFHSVDQFLHKFGAPNGVSLKMKDLPGQVLFMLSYFQQIHLTLVKFLPCIFQIEMELGFLGRRKLEHSIRENAFADAAQTSRT